MTARSLALKSQLQKSPSLAFSGAISAAGAAVFALAKRTANYRDETTKLARSVGLPVQEFSELRHATEQAGLGLEDTRAVLSKLSGPTAGQAKLLKSLGVELTDLQGNSTSTVERLNQLADHIEGIEDPAKKTEIALQIFGRQGAKGRLFAYAGISGTG